MFQPHGYPASALDDLRNGAFNSFIDAARWLAALMVFTGHLRNPLFLGYSAVPPGDRNIFVQGWFFITGFHAEAVVVFFVLSGYLVGGAAIARATAGSFKAQDYFVDRVTRIFIPFLPALLLTVLLDGIGSAMFGPTGFYTHEHPMIREKVVPPSFDSLRTVQKFFATALMLEDSIAAPYGSNQPLWTIALEFRFYIVFGCAMLAVVPRQIWQRVGAFILLALLALVWGPKFLAYMGLWLIGAITVFVPWRQTERPLIALAAFGLMLVAARLAAEHFKSSDNLIMVKDYFIASSFAWLLISMRGTQSKLFAASARPNRFMADFSYSLYLIHFPLMLFLLAALHATGRFADIAKGYSPASAQGIFVYLLLIAIVMCCAWLFSQATEMQTWKVRKWAKGMLANWRGRAASAA